MILERVEKKHISPRIHTCFDVSVEFPEEPPQGAYCFVSPVLHALRVKDVPQKYLSQGTSCCHLGWKSTVEGSNKHDKRKKRLCSEILGIKALENSKGNRESRKPSTCPGSISAQKDLKTINFHFFFFFFGPVKAYGLLGPQPGIKTILTEEARVLNTLVLITTGSA